jgi:beta-phosphoglucomutase-like phosphatase (HAD superfamily)
VRAVGARGDRVKGEGPDAVGAPARAWEDASVQGPAGEAEDRGGARDRRAAPAGGGTPARPIVAAIFDVDGVLVDSPHERAWREALAELMAGEWRDIRRASRWAPDAFTAEVYRAEASGRRRLDGARALLEHFGVPDAAARARAYADRKQALVRRLIEAGAFTAYPDALRFLGAVRAAGLRVAAASSSQNARLLLERIPLDAAAPAGHDARGAASAGGSLADLLDADVSGLDVPGKPRPDLFLAAARALGVAPAQAVVVEDAPAGVEAAKAGGMAAIGVARGDDAAVALARAGADLVVPTLDAVDVAALAAGRLRARGGGG